MEIIKLTSDSLKLVFEALSSETFIISSMYLKLVLPEVVILKVKSAESIL